MSTLYEAIGGADGVLRLAHAWHERVLADEIVAHAFSHGFHPQHTERLAAYWSEAWGGPATYSERCGDETSVVRMHSGNGPHEEMDRRAIACFDQAMEDVRITDPELRRVLHDYFAWATNTTMAAYHDDPADVPNGLRIPRWSWDGLEMPNETPAYPYATHLDILYPHLAKVDVPALASTVKDQWWNQTLCQVNGSVVRLGVMQDEYHWHKHEHDDEFFFCLEGEFLVDLEDRTVTLGPQQGVVVPKGVVHRTRAPQRCVILMVENAGIVPTGD